MIALRRLVLVTLAAAILMLPAACSSLAPATSPPHLRHSPGAFVVVLDGHFDAGRFRFDFPSSWRLVKQSEAIAELMNIVLVAPDGGTVTLMEIDPDAEASGGTIGLDNGVVMRVIIDPADDPSPAFNAQAEQSVSSIRS